VTGGPSSVVFEYEGADRLMKDDGKGGDRLAGDGIYTLAFPAEEILRKLTVASVFRPFVGFCKPLRADSPISRYNTFAEIWTPDIPPVAPVQIAADFQASANLVNIRGQVPLGSFGSFDGEFWAKRFYGHFGDDYDFLNFVLLPGRRHNRYHQHVKNTVKGIGLSPFDRSADYGSAGRLQGISVFSISYFFDGAESGYQHELGHQWINFLQSTPLGSGVPHWPISDLASGVMGFNIPGGVVGGEFPFDLVPEGENYRLRLKADREPVFNDLELYLMGLLPPASVGSHFVFQNQNQRLADGGLLLGPVTRVSIEDIVDAVGPRDPDSTVSPKKFRIATILISDELLSLEAMSFFDFFAQRAELRQETPFSSGFAQGIAKPFFVSTGGRGEISTRLDHELLGPTFQRGDANSDGLLDLSDGVSLLSYLFLSGESLTCLDSADSDDSGELDLTDAIYLLDYLFLGGSPPRAPFSECGRDGPGDLLGCESFAACE